MIIDPRPLGVVEWTDRIQLLTDKFGPVIRLDNPDNWREWAVNTLFTIGLNNAAVNPYAFEDWLSWAIRFSQLSDTLLD